jgi:succinylglutamate desuccinylase
LNPISPETTSQLAYFTKHSAGLTPFCMSITSPNPGTHVVIVGGTHGNEPGGVKAIVELHRAFGNGKVSLNQGKISFLLGNPNAYEKDIRYIDYDLNRHFNKREASSVEGRRALEIKRFLKDNDDIEALLDLHSVSIGDFRLLVYTKDDTDKTEFAMKISAIPLHFVFHPEHMPGTLIEAASSHGIRGLIVECGNHYAAQAVETARYHILKFLIHHHLIDDSYMSPESRPASITFYESIQAIIPHGGFRFLIKDVKTGTKLSKGQKFAVDDHGDHVAPQDCYVVVPSRVVKATDADAGFLGKRSVKEGSALRRER